MRKLITAAASAVAIAGFSVANAVPVTFTGTLGAVEEAENRPDGSTNPVGAGGDEFTITLDYDEDSDSFTSAMIMIGDASDDAEIIEVDILDVMQSANPNAIDKLTIELVSTEGDLPGNFTLGFDFFNMALDDESLGGALAALDDMGMLICSHIMFNFGGFKFEGTLEEGGIQIGNVDPIPLPGAAVFMLSGLAAAGVARRRRQA